jgi:PadR family transcriptional regulator, regulatory protein PadR
MSFHTSDDFCIALPQGSRYKIRMKRKKTNPDFLNGVPELLILHLLASRPMYGYQLVQSIRQATNETLEFGEGCVYPILHRLEVEGLLLSKRETVGGRSRVIYRITGNGTKQLAATVSSWQQIVQAINHALQGGEHGQPAVA